MPNQTKKTNFLAKPMAEPYIAQRVIQLLAGVSHQASILDIATGQGYLAEQLYHQGYHNLHCADINAQNFKLDKKTYHFQPVNANGTLPYSNAQFDVVISCETIEHLENPLQFIREVSRILKPGGLFILSTPSVEGIISRLFFLITGRLAFHTDNDYHLSGHITVLPSWLIEKFTRQAGFTLNQRTYSSFYIPILKQRLTHPFFLNRFWGWIAVYSFTKNPL